jgi:DNA adenine methylase
MNIERCQESFLSDANSQLITTYKAVRDYPKKVIDELSTYLNTEEFYYYIRNIDPSSDEVLTAARFIYLNQTSFN